MKLFIIAVIALSLFMSTSAQCDVNAVEVCTTNFENMVCRLTF